MGRNGLRHALVGAGAVLVAAASVAQGGPGGRPELPPVLAKAFRAAFKLTYSGERVVSFRRGHDRTRHIEYILKQGPRVRITFPVDSPMAGQVVVENGRERQHFFPSTNEIHVGPSMLDDSFNKLSMFFGKDRSERPKVTVTAGESVAGQKTSEVALQGSAGNVFQRLWIDDRTGLILKRELYDSVGGVVGFFEFTKVNYSPDVRPDDFLIQRPNAVRVTPEDVARRLMRENGMGAAFLKEERGIRLIAARQLKRVENARVLILTYETGRAPLSLVQVVGKIESDRLDRLTGKQFNSYSWQMSGRTFVLIGDMDVSELKRLSNRVEIR